MKNYLDIKKRRMEGMTLFTTDCARKEAFIKVMRELVAQNPRGHCGKPIFLWAVSRKLSSIIYQGVSWCDISRNNYVSGGYPQMYDFAQERNI